VILIGFMVQCKVSRLVRTYWYDYKLKELVAKCLLEVGHHSVSLCDLTNTILWKYRKVHP